MPHDIPVITNSHESSYDLTLAEVAALTDRTSRTVRRWVEVGLKGRGVLPAIKTINGIRFRAEDVEAFLQPERVQSLPATEPTRTDEIISRIVQRAPELVDGQRERLAAILGGGR